MPPVTAATTSTARKSPPLVIAAIATGALVMLVLGSLGNPFPTAATAMALIETSVYAGLPAAAYLLGAIGLGRLFVPLLRRAADLPALQAALGLGAMLSLSHLLGVFGVLGSGAGRAVAISLPAIGLALLGQQVIAAGRRARDSAGRVWLLSVVGLPAAALMLVAASSPPGWLWESEGRGYDVLSYHLQLPQEWLAMGRIAPLEHNVYSYLPSYVESAFYQVAVMTGAAGAPRGMLRGEAYELLAAQWLHAGIAILGAFMIARLVMALVEPLEEQRADGPSPRAVAAGSLAGGLFLSVPWVIVTGSLAYNDLGVVAMMAAALIAATNLRQSAARRGMLVGLLVGAACGIKPTALLFVGLPAGVMMLAWTPRREWLPLVASGAIAGLVMLAPWLIRNAAHAGNPIFPFGAGLLGYGHWDSEQASRYAAAHRFNGSWGERLRLLVVADPADPAGPRHRGLLHPQWSVFFPLVLIAGAAALVLIRTRAVAMWLCLLLALQLAVWLVATHVQSRFLLPLAAPGAALFGVAVWGLMARLRLISLGAVGLVIITFGTSLYLFSREPHLEVNGMPAGPNEMLVPGAALRSGEFLRAEFERAGPGEQRAAAQDLGPESFVNLALPPGSRVYLLGEATPLYYTRPTVYATTWDRSLLQEAILSGPGSPSQWAERLRAAGVTHVLVNIAELDRLSRSGFLDPVLEPERINEFLASSTRPVQRWPSAGVALYELIPPGEGGGP
jgi:hypothetical protein